MAAGAAALRRLQDRSCYERLQDLGGRLERALTEAALNAEVEVRVQRVGSMLTPFFCRDAVVDETSARRSDTAAYARFFHALLDRGIYPPPSQFEAWFVSLTHTEEDLEAALPAIGEAVEAATHP